MDRYLDFELTWKNNHLHIYVSEKSVNVIIFIKKYLFKQINNNVNVKMIIVYNECWMNIFIAELMMKKEIDTINLSLFLLITLLKI